MRLFLLAPRPKSRRHHINKGWAWFEATLKQSGRYVNLRTPGCHGKRRVAGTRSYASYRDRFPLFGRKLALQVQVDVDRSSRAESGVTIDRLLSCFRSRRNGVCKPDEQCKSNGRQLFLQSPTARRNGKVNASFIENRSKIQALRVSEARRWRREYGASMEMAFF